jgi:hypothetical protein
MADEQDDDLEAKVDEGAEMETERFPNVSEDDEEAELLPESKKSEEPAVVDDEDEEASDTI